MRRLCWDFFRNRNSAQTPRAFADIEASSDAPRTRHARSCQMHDTLDLAELIGDAMCLYFLCNRVRVST